jgi:AcrR family transcriptional regulator
MQHAPIEEIAKAVGIARGLVYRQFSSKEELFVLTVTDYFGAPPRDGAARGRAWAAA